MAEMRAWWLTLLRGDQAALTAREREAARAAVDHAVIGGSAWEGFHAVFRSPYLLVICAYVLILAVMSTFIYFTRLQMVAALGTNIDMRTTVFAQIDMITQTATLILQAFVAPSAEIPGETPAQVRAVEQAGVDAERPHRRDQMGGIAHEETVNTLPDIGTEIDDKRSGEKKVIAERVPFSPELPPADGSRRSV